MAHEIIATLEKQLGRSCHPLEGLLRIAADESQPVELRATCFRDALPYVLPRLQQSAVAVAGSLEVDGPPSVEINIDALIKGDESLRNSAIQVAMALCEAECAEVEGDQPQRLLSSPMEKDQQGHWKE